MSKNFANVRRKRDNTGMEMPDIILAAERGDVETIEVALSLGEDINIQEAATGITPLHAAIAGAHFNAVRFLASHEDIDLDIKDKFGRSAVGLALLLNDDKVVEELRSVQMNIEDNGNPDPSVVVFPTKDP